MRDDDSAPSARPEPTFAPDGLADPRVDEDERLLTTAEASRVLGLTVGTLSTYRTHRRRGWLRGPRFVETASGPRYRPRDLREFASVQAEV